MQALRTDNGQQVMPYWTLAGSMEHAAGHSSQRRTVTELWDGADKKNVKNAQPGDSDCRLTTPAALTSFRCGPAWKTTARRRAFARGDANDRGPFRSAALTIYRGRNRQISDRYLQPSGGYLGGLSRIRPDG